MQAPGPGPVPGRFSRLLAYDSTFFVPPIVPAFGPGGAATFVLSLEPGTKITFSWLTEIITSYDGTEQRISYQEQPSTRIEGSAFLLDVDSRLTRAALMRSAASGETFLVALPHEEQIIMAVIGALVISVTIGDTSGIDWAQIGQRVVIVGNDGISGSAVIQSVTATDLGIDAVPPGVTLLGAHIMPAVPVLLDPQQGFTRYPVTVDMWDVRAKSVAYGWAGVDAMGRGAQVLTFDAGLVAATDLTDDNLIIWDRPNFVDGTSAETLASRTDVVDFGGIAFSSGGAEVPDWLRPIKMRSTALEDYQWLKAVTRHLRGAQGMFLLPAERSDIAIATHEVATFLSASVPVVTRTTSLVVTAPEGTQLGDVVLMFSWASNDSVATLNTAALPSGWSVLSNILTAGNRRGILLRRIVTDSEPASHTFNCTANGVNGVYGVCLAYRSLDIAAAVVDSAVADQVSTTSFVAPSVTLTRSSDLYLGIAWGNLGAVTSTAPIGTSERVNATPAEDAQTHLEAFDLQPFIVGATGTKTTTFSAAVSGVAAAYAFRVAPSPIVAFGSVTVIGDYVTWFASSAHRRLSVTTTSGITQYLTAESVVDNGDGTNTITFSENAIGPIDRIAILEQVRLETDDVPIVWDGAVFTCDLVAHVVQDVITTTEDIVTSVFAGSGLDGNFTFPTGTYSMTRDMYWETGQLQAGSIVVTNGFVPHFRTALIGPPSGTATIHRNGANASGATAGVGFAAGTGTLSGGSGTGATGNITVGAAASAFGFWPATRHPGFGGAGGDSSIGSGTGGAAGGGPSSLAPATSGSIDDAFAAIRMRFMTASLTAISGGAGGSSGGGTGAGFGGGGGAGAGNVVVIAGQYINPETIIVQSKGGTGGAGSTTGCGGGGGGGGGIVVVVSGRLPFPSTVDNSGGAGGASGGGSGKPGSTGSSGPPPILLLG